MFLNEVRVHKTMSRTTVNESTSRNRRLSNRKNNRNRQRIQTGKSKEAIKYLKIFGANCFGNKLEKKSFLDRVAWIDNNTEDIINFDNSILLNKAENIR